MSRLLVIAIPLLLVAGAALSDDQAPAARLPGAVGRAQTTLAGWVDGLLKKSPEQVEKLLGPAGKDTWEHKGKKELLLRYTTAAEKGSLSIYFFQDRVIKVSYLLLSH